MFCVWHCDMRIFLYQVYSCSTVNIKWALYCYLSFAAMNQITLLRMQCTEKIMMTRLKSRLQRSQQQLQRVEEDSQVLQWILRTPRYIEKDTNYSDHCLGVLFMETAFSVWFNGTCSVNLSHIIKYNSCHLPRKPLTWLHNV